MMLSDYLYKKAGQNKIPLSGTFELSPVCNFACKMCYVRRTPEQIRQMGKSLIPWESWLELGRQCKENGMLYLLLTGGEPFLYPGFRELYEQLHDMGLLIAINSNGTMIDEDTVRWLKQRAPYRINITLYGTSRETYQRICGNAGGYDRAMKAITMLKEAGIPVVINASMIPENANDLEEIIQTGKKLNLNTRVSTYMFPPVRREKEEDDSRFTPEQSAAMFLRKIKCSHSTDDCRGWMRQKLDGMNPVADDADTWGHAEEFMRCRAGRSSFWISWDGVMTACGMVPFPLAVYPFERDFADCWMELTDRVRCTAVLNGCAGCEKREICNPCVAQIYSETGTVTEKAPYLCELADSVIKRMKDELEESGNE